MARTSRLLVVDASVVQSAGDTEHPVSSACRECLDAIYTICHRVAVTDKVKVEWDKHMGRFARKWRRFMAGRKKPIKLVSPAVVLLDLTQFSESASRAIQKDMCLLEAALKTDRIIITRDAGLQAALREQPAGQKLLDSITWINPVENGVSAIRALE